MRHSARTAICAAAVSCLAGVFANDSAKAEVFDFTFVTGLPNSTGTFTTGAPSSTDPGFDLITRVTFNQLHVIGMAPGFEPLRLNAVGLIVPTLFSGAAFDPATLAFINHGAEGPFNNIGDLFLEDGGTQIIISGPSFSQGSSHLSGNIFDPQVLGSPTFNFSAAGALVITPGPTPSVPEPATWAMMLIGFAGLGFMGYRRARGRGAATRLA